MDLKDIGDADRFHRKNVVRMETQCVRKAVAEVVERSLLKFSIRCANSGSCSCFLSSSLLLTFADDDVVVVVQLLISQLSPFELFAGLLYDRNDCLTRLRHLEVESF